MLTRRTIMLGAACAAVVKPANAPAADTSARGFVTAIYEAYKGKNGNGHPLDDDRAIRRYFEPSLAALISKDQKEAARRDEVGALDFDPFVEAADWDIPAFDISVSDTAPGKASATVNFRNSGKPTMVVLDLVRIKNEWKISDITWTSNDKTATLRGIFGH